LSKIISRIFGGVGNQLFCYAAARRLALVNNAELIIDDTSGFVHDLAYQRNYQLDHFNIPCRKATTVERLEPFSRVRRYLKRACNRRRPFEERNYIQQEGIDFDSRLLQVKTHGTVYLEGYWQSENYFKDVEETIRTELRIIPPTDALSQGMAEEIRNSLAVALHVRWHASTDNAAINDVLSDYYQRAIALMERQFESPRYFLFSDDPKAARAKLILPEGRVTFVSQDRGDGASRNRGFDENAIAELWLMTQCRNFIIANSTCSWWGAWLGEHGGKQVIAPGVKIIGSRRVTSWGFKGLLPQSWIRL
jgi:hypothetical protein